MLDSCCHQDPCTASPTRPRIATLRHPSRAVRRAIEFIEANLAGDIRLTDIAAAAGQSLFHFSRTFRSATGLTPHRYLTQARIERAKTLLREGDLPLVVIADEAGFSDQSHMSRVFRRMTGWTPKSFRAGCGGPETPRPQV
jgi:AraC family transcriptional regulator